MSQILKVTPALAKIIGQGSATRTQGLKKIWEYVRANNLQNPINKREIIPNADLKDVLNQTSVNLTEVMKLMNPHFIADPNAPREPKIARAPRVKKEPKAKTPKIKVPKDPNAPKRTRKPKTPTA